MGKTNVLSENFQFRCCLKEKAMPVYVISSIRFIHENQTEFIKTITNRTYFNFRIVIHG